jgi:hypothetical protein
MFKDQNTLPQQALYEKIPILVVDPAKVSEDSELVKMITGAIPTSSGNVRVEAQYAPVIFPWTKIEKGSVLSIQDVMKNVNALAYDCEPWDFAVFRGVKFGGRTSEHVYGIAAIQNNRSIAGIEVSTL